MKIEYQLIAYHIKVEICSQKQFQAVINNTKRVPEIRF